MTILNLQYLRGVAALLVVILHVEAQVKRFGYRGHWPEWPAAGVDLFFILSGFLMWAITAERSQSPRQFFMQRVARVVPLYYLITTFVVLIMLFAPKLMLTGRFLFSQAAGSYLFLGLPDVAGEPNPVVRVGWTLNLEMLFYVIFAFSLWARRNQRGIIVAVVLASIVFVGSVIAPQNKWTSLYTSSVLFEFVYGMGIAEIYRRGFLKRIEPPLACLLIGVGAVAIIFTAPNAPLRGIWVGIPAMAVFVGVLALNETTGARPLRWFKLLGDASYSLYLTHLIVLSLAYQVWMLVGAPVHQRMLLVFIPYALLLCVGMAIGVYKLVEAPLTKKIQRKVKSSSSSLYPGEMGRDVPVA